MKKYKLQLTVNFIQDPQDKGYTAYFAEIPEAVADGRTQGEATANLIEALNSLLATRKLLTPPDNPIDGKITTKKLELASA